MLVTEIDKLLDGITPSQAERLIYAMERKGLVKRIFTDVRQQVLEAEVKDYIGKMQVLGQRNTELRELVINLEVQLEDARIRNRVLQDRLERVIRGAVS